MIAKEIIWVGKEFAEEFKAYEGEANQAELQKKALDDYLETVTEEAKRDFRVSFESLEDDVAIFKGLMTTVKLAFEKAKNEQLNASYGLWEKFEDEIPSVKLKTEQMIETLSPLCEKLNEVDSLFKKIKTFEIDRLYESIKNISDLYGKNKEMVEFLLKNLKK